MKNLKPLTDMEGNFYGGIPVQVRLDPFLKITKLEIDILCSDGSFIKPNPNFKEKHTIIIGSLICNGFLTCYIFREPDNILTLEFEHLTIIDNNAEIHFNS